jgi:hemolysin activation/secretion protein
MHPSTTPHWRAALQSLAVGAALLVTLCAPSLAQPQDEPPVATRRSSIMWGIVKNKEAIPLHPTSVAVHDWKQGKDALNAPAIATHPTPTPSGSPGARPAPTPVAVRPPVPAKGRLGEIRIEGNKHYSTAFIRRQFEPAIKNGAFDLTKFQHQLLILNDFPDLNVKAYIQPGKEPGVYDVVLKVKDGDAFAGAAEYNNFGNPAVGEDRLGLTLAKGNLSGNGDTLAVRALSAFTSRDTNPFIQAQYTTPVNPDGATVSVLYATGGFVAGNQLTLFDIRGNSSLYGVAGTILLDQSLNQKTTLSLGYYSKSASTALAGQTSSQDQVREMVASLAQGWKTPTSSNSLTVAVTSGLGTLFGGTPANDPVASRRGASDNFVRVNADYARIQSLGYPYLILRGSGQWASSPLLVTEQFPVGGQDSVRGYTLAEFLGDAGYTVSAELRLPLGSKDSDFQAAWFIDHGRAWLINPLPGERASVTLTGTGVGLRARLFGQTFGSVDVGYPLEPAGNPSRKGAQIYGQIITKF